MSEAKGPSKVRPWIGPEALAQWKIGAALAAAFLGAYFLPVGEARFDGAVHEGLALVRWYAREHVVLCLLPAFFIAGAIGTFVRREAVLRFLGPTAPRPLAYGVASVSGTLLAVCSCTVLPIFAGIWRAGAGLGPATAFLYAGPAINALAILLTAQVLGWELGVARAVGAVVFSLVIGLAMAFIFRNEAAPRPAKAQATTEGGGRSLGATATWIGLLVGVLVFATWSEDPRASGLYALIGRWKWPLASLCGLGVGTALWRLFRVAPWKLAAAGGAVAAVALALPLERNWAFATGVFALGTLTATSEGELREWFDQSWDFAKQIAPLLLAGVFVAGLLLGRPGQEGLVPSRWIAEAVGGNSPGANLLSALVGALMYFATLTEIPILEGLIGSGMGSGPALALLLAGPALSLPSILVLRTVLGLRKTLTYCALVVVFATLTGWLYGLIA